MKKVLFTIGVCGMLFFVSCKKERTCTCVTTDTSNNTTVGTTKATFKSSKKDGESTCSGSEGSAGTYRTTCTLD